MTGRRKSERNRYSAKKFESRENTSKKEFILLQKVQAESASEFTHKSISGIEKKVNFSLLPFALNGWRGAKFQKNCCDPRRSRKSLFFCRAEKGGVFFLQKGYHRKCVCVFRNLDTKKE